MLDEIEDNMAAHAAQAVATKAVPSLVEESFPSATVTDFTPEQVEPILSFIETPQFSYEKLSGRKFSYSIWGLHVMRQVP